MALTNPGNTVRVHSRNGGRASVYEANMWAQKLSGGLFSGNGVLQNTPSVNMNVKVGGTAANPDVVIASNPSGFKIALDLVSQQTILLAAPASNSRIASIVAYCDDLSINSVDNTTTGSQSSCGLIIVYGATSASPTAPTDANIRSAITTDGATGSQACYAVLTSITLTSATTTITQTMIDAGKFLAQFDASVVLQDNSVTAGKIKSATFPKFSVYRASAQTLPTNSDGKISFETKLWDTYNAFNTTTNRFVAPVAGYYRLSWEVDINSSTGFIGFSTLYKNNTPYKRGARSLLSAAGAIGSSGSAQIYLASNDYVEIFCYASAGTAVVGVGSQNAWFDGEFIGSA